MGRAWLAGFWDWVGGGEGGVVLGCLESGEVRGLGWVGGGGFAGGMGNVEGWMGGLGIERKSC